MHKNFWGDVVLDLKEKSVSSIIQYGLLPASPPSSLEMAWTLQISNIMANLTVSCNAMVCDPVSTSLNHAGVFCQSAIENAQKDQAAVVQNILDNKDTRLQWCLCPGPSGYGSKLRPPPTTN